MNIKQIVSKDYSNKAIALLKTNKRIILNLATGVGKSKIAIDCINSYNYDNIKVLFIVAERAHKKNWKEEFDKWKLITDNYRIECYNSLHKCLEDNYDIVIFDEAHHLCTPLRFMYHDNVKAKKFIYLSATSKFELLEHLNAIDYKMPPVIYCSLKKAIEKKVLPTPKVEVHMLSLNDSIPSEYYIEYIGCTEKSFNPKTMIMYECNYNRRMEYFRTSFLIRERKYAVKVYCTQQEKYNYYNRIIEEYKNTYLATREEWAKIKWLRAGSERKRFLGTIKTNYAKDLIKTLNNKRFICFCTSIDQANKIGNKDNIIHSKVKNPLNVIESFNNKDINSLVAVGMLQEGQNLKDIECGIIVQLDGKEGPFIQKFGRTLRSEHPVQYIICIKGTQDNVYLERVIKNLDPNHVKYIEV